MDTLVLKPTYENLFESYNQDAVGRNADVFAFIETLNEFDTSMSIAIDGNWGSGKSFFVQQVKMVMDAHNDHVPAGKLEHRDEIIYLRGKHYEGKTEPELQPQVCVYYDAWENDNDDDPILSLVYTILQEVKADFDCKKLDFTAIASSIIGLVTARPWGELAKSLKRDDPMESIENAKELEGKIGEFLDSLLSERGNRLVIFIDELDRCKPEYAVRLLERIKHYFDHESITFVFSVNTNELQHTIKRFYGEGFDGARYLDRFFDFRMTLPAVNWKKYYQIIKFGETPYIFNLVCHAVIDVYHLEIREVAKFLSTAKAAINDEEYVSCCKRLSPDDGVNWGIQYILPIMIGLRIRDKTRYDAFIGGNDSSPMIEIGNAVDFSFDELFSESEKNNAESPDKRHALKEEKLIAVYNAIFNPKRSGRYACETVGTVDFYGETKDKLIDASNLMLKRKT